MLDYEFVGAAITFRPGLVVMATEMAKSRDPNAD